MSISTENVWREKLKRARLSYMTTAERHDYYKFLRQRSAAAASCAPPPTEPESAEPPPVVYVPARRVVADRKPRLRKPLPVRDTGQWIMIHRRHQAFRICLPAKTRPGVSRMWTCRNFWWIWKHSASRR
jgi:hypothetical protein